MANSTANVVRVRDGIASTPLSQDAARVLRNTYAMLAVSLLPAIGGAYVGIQFPLRLGIWLHLGLFMVSVFGLQYMVISNRNSAAGVAWLLLFTGVLGYFLGPLLSYALTFSNGVDLIGMAFGGTAAIFFCLAGYATVTQRNFATPGIGKMLSIGLLMAFVLSIVNFAFINMPAVSLAISVIFMFISSAFIVFTVNSIVRGGERNYISATLTLFIMLYNLFTSLLHILLIFAGNRD